MKKREQRIDWNDKKAELELSLQACEREIGNVKAQRFGLAADAFVHGDEAAKSNLSKLAGRESELSAHLDGINEAIRHCSQQLAAEEQQKRDEIAADRAALAERLTGDIELKGKAVDRALLSLANALKEHSEAIAAIYPVIPSEYATRLGNRFLSSGTLIRAFKHAGIYLENLAPSGRADSFEEIERGISERWRQAAGIYPDGTVTWKNGARDIGIPV